MAEKKEDEFLCEALADYYAVADDELDLKAGDVYTIIETSESGWWYALDNEGIDGWVPSNYLEKLDETAAKNYKEEQALIAERERQEEERKKREKAEKKKKKKEEAEKKKQKKRNKSKKNSSDNNSNDANGASSSTSSNSNNKKGGDSNKKQIGQTTDANVTYSTIDASGNKLTIETRPNSRSYAARNPTKSDNWGKKKQDSSGGGGGAGGKKKHEWAWKNKFVTKDDAKEKDDNERDVEEEKKFAQLERPKLTTVPDPNPNPQENFNENKKINEWTHKEIVEYLVKHPNTTNTFQLKSAIGYLTSLVINDAEMKEWVLKQNGLNVILNVLRFCDKDIAVAMSCCLAITTLCQHGASMQFSAEKAGVFYLTTAIRASFQNPRFCFAAFNCICNFTKGNDKHKSFIVGDEHNKTIVRYIIEGMQKFRYEDDSDKNYHCIKVQTAACLALQNLAASELGQIVIGKEGVSQVLDALIAHVDNNQVVAAALGTLSNLCGNEANGITFLQDDGLMYLSTLLENPDLPMKDRIVATRLMQNLALKPATAQKLAKLEETIDVSIELLINADFGSELYVSSLKFVNALILRCPDAKVKEKLMVQYNEQNLVDIVSQALTETFEDLMEQNLNSVENRTRISSMYGSIAAILLAYFKSGNKELSDVIVANAESSETFIPNYLIRPCIDCPSSQLLYSVFAICFELCNTAQLQKTLIEGELLKLLFETEWYTVANVDDNVLKLGSGVILKLLSQYQSHSQYWTLQENSAAIRAFTSWAQQNKPPIQQFTTNIDKMLANAERNYA